MISSLATPAVPATCLTGNDKPLLPPTTVLHASMVGGSITGRFCGPASLQITTIFCALPRCHAMPPAPDRLLGDGSTACLPVGIQVPTAMVPFSTVLLLLLFLDHEPPAPPTTCILTHGVCDDHHHLVVLAYIPLLVGDTTCTCPPCLGWTVVGPAAVLCCTHLLPLGKIMVNMACACCVCACKKAAACKRKRVSVCIPISSDSSSPLSLLISPISLSHFPSTPTTPSVQISCLFLCHASFVLLLLPCYLPCAM